MNTEDYVSYEQAAKLKECGFDWETEYYYEFEEPTDTEVVFKRTSSCNGFNHNAFEESYCSPTMAQAAKWLRDVKNIHVLPILENVNKADYCCHVTHLRKDSMRIIDSCKYFSTYEKALSAGVDAALGLLKRTEI